MAFNPFHAFRKHQKALFAALTILCMITFVLAGFGRGDFFSYVTEKIGYRSMRQKDRAAYIYGEPVSEQEVAELQRGRNLANTYISIAVEEAHQNVIRRVGAELLPALKDDPATNEIRSLLQYRQLALGANAQYRSYFSQVYQQGLGMNFDRLERLRQTFAAAQKDSEAALVQQLKEVLLQDAQLFQRGRELYFGGSAKTARDVLDFKIWLVQADRLGIQLTRGDVGRLINQEALRQLSQQSFRAVDEYFRMQYRNVPPDALVTALGNEFRVRLAKAAFLGFDVRAESAVPPAITPYEYWQFFRTERTESMVELLPIPVRNADYLAKVGKPTEEDLKSLYEKYKLFEPAPDSDVPGFKEPPRIEVQWVAARTDSPYYQEQAKKMLQLQRDLSQAMAAVIVPTGGIAPTAVSLSLPLAYDLPLVAKYEDISYRFRAPSWTDPYDLSSHKENRNRAESVAALVGQAAASAGTLSPLVAAPAAYEGPAFGREARDRSRIWATFVLAGAGNNPVTAAGLVYALTPRSPHLPLDEVRAQVTERLQEGYAQELVTKNLEKVREELERLSGEQPTKLRQAQSAGQPTTVAAVLGQVTGALGTGAAAWSAPLTYGELVRARDLKEGRQMAGAAFMAGATGNPLTSAAFLYREQSQPEMQAKKFVAEAIARYHLLHGTTRQPRNRFNIAEDPGLTPLKESYERSHVHEPQIKNFGQLFFPTSRAYDPQRWPRSSSARSMRFQMPDPIWNLSKEPFLYWKTGDLAAYVPTFAEAKPKVEEAWRLEKAQKLAQEEADKVAAEARKAKGDAGRVLKDGSPHSGKPFTLDRVSRLTKPTFAVQTRDFGTVYQPYRVPEERVEYPSEDFLDKLLGLKERGDVVVVHDKPKTTYYVAALVHRAPPDEKAFYDDYAKHAGALVAQIEARRHFRQEFRDAVTRRLEGEANLQFVGDFQKRFESQRGSSDEE